MTTKIIDLTRSLDKATASFPGDRPLDYETEGTYLKQQFITNVVRSSMHVGTHIDAPLHMIENGKSVADFPVDKFFGRGVLIDAKKLIDNNEIQVPKDVKLKKGDIVLVMTGMDSEFGKKNYFYNYPALSKSFAQWLIDNQVSIVGVDSCSPDYYPFPVHKSLLNKEILIIENLTNLKKLINKKNFEVVSLPIKISIEGSWVRIVARVIEKN
jgi:kynurenine formamidase